MPVPTFAAGETLPPSKLRALAARDSYTPSLTATTTNPNLGTLPTIEGEFYVTGQLVVVFVNIQFGSGATAGSGDYRISVPAAYPIDSIYTSTSTPLLGNIRLRDNSVPNETVWVPFTSSSEGSGNISVRNPDSPNSQQAGSGTPWTWAVDDRIIGTFSYITSG